MSFIAVQFGYNQQRLFNTNCEVAPLMDAIHKECYKDMSAKLAEREDFFNKEIGSFKKELNTLEKKLDKLEQPPPEAPPKVPAFDKATTDGKKKKGKKTKKELEEEERLKKEAEEAERLKAEEEERKR